MIIHNSSEPIGAEIDCGVHSTPPAHHRLTLRKVGEDEWQAVKYLFSTKKEEEIKRGTLKEIVLFVNLRYSYKDVAEE